MSAERSLPSEVLAARERPALFVLGGEPYARGLIAVSGGDAPRWLDGMVTNDVAALSAGRPANGCYEGCYAALLTRKGRIVADIHLLAREDDYWLEVSASTTTEVLAQLARYIVADDVELTDRSLEFSRLAVEGPGATALVAAVSGTALEEVPREGFALGSIAAAEIVLARFGWTGEDAWQLFVRPSDREAVCAAITQAGALRGSLDALEILRIEAGVPLQGRELGQDVFPDEARLETAISRTKGCYTGQEIVARLYSRGAVNRLLVSLHFLGDRVPAPGALLSADEKRSGQVTSASLSPSAGAIGLGYVRRAHAELGTELRCEDPAGGLIAQVVAPPFPGSASSP